MKEWAIDIGVGAVLGFLVVTFTIGLFVEGNALSGLVLAGMIGGVIAMRRGRRMRTQSP